MLQFYHGKTVKVFALMALKVFVYSDYISLHHSTLKAEESCQAFHPLQTEFRNNKTQLTRHGENLDRIQFRCSKRNLIYPACLFPTY